jgi:hypothetical protein
MFQRIREALTSLVLRRSSFLMEESMSAKKSSKARFFCNQLEIKDLGMTPYLDHTGWQSQLRK